MLPCRAADPFAVVRGRIVMRIERLLRLLKQRISRDGIEVNGQ
jgi:hypothetical protein